MGGWPWMSCWRAGSATGFSGSTTTPTLPFRGKCGAFRSLATSPCSRACSPSSPCTSSWRSRTTGRGYELPTRCGLWARGSSRRSIPTRTFLARRPSATGAYWRLGPSCTRTRLWGATVSLGRGRSWTGTPRWGREPGSLPGASWGRALASGRGSSSDRTRASAARRSSAATRRSVRCSTLTGRALDLTGAAPRSLSGFDPGGVGGVDRLGGLGRLGSRTIGLDIDRGALKAVQVSRSAGEFTLRHVGYHRLPPGAVVDGEVADVEVLGAEIREFWSSHSFKGKSVILGIANGRVVVRLLDFPRMEEEDLKSAITFEAQDHIPMSLDEAVLDYVVLGPQAEGSDLDRILIVAAHRDMIGGYISAVRAGGLRPAGIDVKALSLTRSTLPDTFFDEGSTLLMDVGTELTNLVITQGGNPALTRFIPLGMDRLVEAVTGAADLPEEEAEKQALNPRGGLGYEAAEHDESPEEDDLDPALAYDVRRGLEEAVQTLAEDVQRSIEYHHSQPESREVLQVFVSGEGALVPGFDGYLGEL